MKATKIVSTIGPATSSPAHLKKLADSGINVARLNFSHGSHEYHLGTIQALQKLNEKRADAIAILLDTKGPEIRTGDVEKNIAVRKGETVIFSTIPMPKRTHTVILVNHKGFPKDAKKSPTILIDNGEMEFTMKKCTPTAVYAVAKDSGEIGSRRHVNLPGADISLPSFTQKDWDDISFGIKNNVDFVAPSFVRNGNDIRELRAFLKKKNSAIQIIAKIETKQAIEHLDDIIDASDGIMVARGDLGAEIPFERVPGIQDDIVLQCRRKGKFVIVATQMLESMIENPMPTRAEVMDIAHAVLTQTDAVMLSGETAAGKYPFKSVDAMVRTIKNTESRRKNANEQFISLQSTDAGMPRNEQCLAACVLANNLKAKAIIAITRQGGTARAVSQFRPTVPVYAGTEDEQVQRQLGLIWGVRAFPLHLGDPEDTVISALAHCKKHFKLRDTDTVIVVSDILVKRGSATRSTHGHVMTVQIRKVG